MAPKNKMFMLSAALEKTDRQAVLLGFVAIRNVLRQWRLTGDHASPPPMDHSPPGPRGSTGINDVVSFRFPRRRFSTVIQYVGNTEDELGSVPTLSEMNADPLLMDEDRKMFNLRQKGVRKFAYEAVLSLPTREQPVPSPVARLHFFVGDDGSMFEVEEFTPPNNTGPSHLRPARPTMAVMVEGGRLCLDPAEERTGRFVQARVLKLLEAKEGMSKNAIIRATLLSSDSRSEAMLTSVKADGLVPRQAFLAETRKTFVEQARRKTERTKALGNPVLGRFGSALDLVARVGDEFVGDEQQRVCVDEEEDIRRRTSGGGGGKIQSPKKRNVDDVDWFFQEDEEESPSDLPVPVTKSFSGKTIPLSELLTNTFQAADEDFEEFLGFDGSGKLLRAMFLESCPGENGGSFFRHASDYLLDPHAGDPRDQDLPFLKDWDIRRRFLLSGAERRTSQLAWLC